MMNRIHPLIMKKSKLILTSCVLSLMLTSCLERPDNKSDIFGPEPVELTVNQQNVVNDINDYAFPLSGSNPNLPFDELSSLNQLGEARIVGLGEATHGTKEFFEMKDRIFRYLVEEHGFKAIAFEMDFAEALIFNDYVLTGEGNLEKLMKEKMFFWTWQTSEVRDLLEWMKNYNLDKAEEDKIQFWGYDTQIIFNNAPILLEKLTSVDANLKDEVGRLLTGYQNLDPDYYRQVAGAYREGIKKSVDSSYALIENEKELIIQNSSEKEFQLILQLARNIVQTEEVRFSNSDPSSRNLRDQFMAENQLWLLDYLGTTTQIASWAHNNHVANNINYGLGGAMGFHLKNKLGEAYQIIGFSFGKGAFTAFSNRLGRNVITQDPLVNSLNFYFYHADPDNFILDLSSLEGGSALNAVIITNTNFLNIGSVFVGNPENYYYELRLKTHYDIIIHFDETEESDLL